MRRRRVMLATTIIAITILAMGAANAANNENKTACIDQNSINTWAAATEATLDAYAAIVGNDSTAHSSIITATAIYENKTASSAVTDATTTNYYAMSKDATAELRPVITTKNDAVGAMANNNQINVDRVKDNGAKTATWALAAVNTGKIVGAATNNANMMSLATAART